MTVQAWGYISPKNLLRERAPLNVRRQLPNSTTYPLSAFLIFLIAFAGCGEQAGTPHVTPSTRGIVTDWTTRHVKFSNPGSEADSIKAGRHAQWLRVMNDPRYQMQQRMRSRSTVVRLPGEHFQLKPTPALNLSSMHRDWAFTIEPDNIENFDMGAFPAKYSFDIDAAPSCADYVIFPVNAPGSSTQANIVGFNNLYDGTCPTSTGDGQPFASTVEFAYYFDSGNVVSSPVLSEDGTKVVIIASNSNGITLHVLTLGNTGNNGSAYNTPVQPCIVNGVQSCTSNNATDTRINISSVAVNGLPDSSPFVDYSTDTAYVGDNFGILHKITGVFHGNPAEVTTGGWPFTVDSGDPLSSPVYDSISQHIFVTAYHGNLYCIDVSSGTAVFCSPSAAIAIGETDITFEGPTVDGTAGTVFAEGDLPYASTLTQTTASMTNTVQATMGSGGATGLFSGDFDNAYYSGNYSSGYLYFCGTNRSALPVLYRIGFNSSGTMNSANDGNSYQLTSSYTPFPCTPLTEAYNTSQNKDYLFLGVSRVGIPTGCNSQACVMSFELGASFPSGPAATLPLGGNGAEPASGIVIDNVSTAAGASQIYFFNNLTGSATQASQNGLN